MIALAIDLSARLWVGALCPTRVSRRTHGDPGAGPEKGPGRGERYWCEFLFNIYVSDF